MIKILDSKERLNNKYGLIIPFSVYGKTDGTFDYEVFDCVRDMVSGETADEIDDYLTESFYSRMNDILGDAVCELGYEPDEVLTRSFIFNYECSAPLDDFGAAQCIDDLSGYCDMTESDFDTDDFPVFAVAQGKTVVSVCGVNGLTGDHSVEIAVATAESFRRHGYALSCLVKMTNYLTSKGYMVSYMCESENEPSSRLAEKAGFTLVSRDYNFVCFEKEE